MPAPDRAWFPTSPGQSATVVALAVMLMLNMTVLLLMVSGELSPALSASPFDEGRLASTVADDYPPTQVQTDDAQLEKYVRPSNPVAPARQVVPYRPSAPKPVEVVSQVVSRPTPTVVPVRAFEPTPAEADDDDEPLTFFGLPVE